MPVKQGVPTLRLRGSEPLHRRPRRCTSGQL